MTKTTKSTGAKKARIIYEGKPKRKGWLTTSIISLIIIILAVFIVSNGTFFLLDNPLFESTSEEEVLVTVNGEPIYVSELDAQWDAIPLDAKVGISRDDLLNRIIEERLLLQQAKLANITVTDEEVETFIAEQLAMLGITPEVFAQYLAMQNTTLEEVSEMYRQQLTIIKLFEEQVDTNITISDEAIESYYENNKEDFYQDEMVTVRHILVEVSDTFNESQADERVAEILSKLDENNSNFCELVTNYSMDLGSVQNCGEYTFSEGQFNNPAFEEPAFAMDEGDVQVVNTTFGKHIMFKIRTIPAGNIGLEDVVEVAPGQPRLKELIAQALQEQKAQEIYDAYVTNLLANSDIVYEAATQESEEEGLELPLEGLGDIIGNDSDVAENEEETITTTNESSEATTQVTIPLASTTSNKTNTTNETA